MADDVEGSTQDFPDSFSPVLSPSKFAIVPVEQDSTYGTVTVVEFDGALAVPEPSTLST